jgi:HEAT repeat protein
MGKTLRTKRVQNVLKIVTNIKREVGGRAVMRGLLLLVLLLTMAGLAAAQFPAELTPENAVRLRRMIENGSVEEKRAALLDIRNLQSAAASAIALPGLGDKDVLVRSTAASSVVYLPKPDAARALIPLLSDRDEFVRREAAHALGEVGDPAASSGLIRLMEKDKVFEVRTSAALALGKIGDPAAVGSLAAILRKRPVEDEEFLRRNAARSIGQIGQISLTGDRTVVTPENFLPEKFKELGPAGVQNVIGTEATEVLITVLRNSSESDDTRREAAFALGWVGDATRAVPALQASMSSTDPYLVEIAREALLRIERRNKFSASKDK